MGLARKINNFAKADKYQLYCGLCERYSHYGMVEKSWRLSARRIHRRMERLTGEGLTPIELATPDKMNQWTHPDLIKVHGEYIMAVTPYPFGIDKLENPVIYRGKNIDKLEYVTGPIDMPEEGYRNHLSDPTIVWAGDDAELYCYYRENVRNRETPLVKIYRQSSEDCEYWSDKELIYEGASDICDVLSPSAVGEHDGSTGGDPLLYFVVKKAGSDPFLGYVSKVPFTEKDIIEVPIEGMPAGKILWHMSAVPYDEGDVLILTIANTYGGRNCELYIGYRDRRGASAVILYKMNLANDRNGIASEYRATGLIEDGHLKVVSSIMFEDGMWGGVLTDEGPIQDIVKR